MADTQTASSLAQLNARRRKRRYGLNLNFAAGNFTMRGQPRGTYRPRRNVFRAPVQKIGRLPNSSFPSLNNVGQVKLSGNKLRMTGKIPSTGGM